MRKNLVVSCIALAGMAFAAAPAAAVIWSQPDGNAHPYVGLAVFDVGGVPSHRCSGTLLTSTVFLTAGHCTFGTDDARVWFESPIADPSYPFGGGTSVGGTPFTHPDFNNFAGFPNTSDVGIIVLDSPVVMGTYGALPAIGAINSLATQRGQQDQHFTIVGYGLQAVIPSLMADLERRQGIPMLVELNSANTGGFNIHLSGNPGSHAPGGACFGDSGGPSLIGTSNVVAGVGSFVLNQNCVGAGFYYRVDTEHAQDFIDGFLP
ncbi:MAG TPA: trypsin-like serine protease [Thermoanaerobaculia bacterium]